MATWTGVVIGWIVVCSTAVFPDPRWGNPPITLFPTQAACIAANQWATAWIADLARRDPRPQDKNEHLTCWCDHVTPAK
jgi:hypothetical protein